LSFRYRAPGQISSGRGLKRLPKTALWRLFAPIDESGYGLWIDATKAVGGGGDIKKTLSRLIYSKISPKKRKINLSKIKSTIL
jgi:hypothetical protein